MYISKIFLQNVRCFKELTIDLKSPSGTRRWAMILGDNGVGKTTVLRCIALGLCDAASASGLLIEPLGREMIRSGERDAIIRIELHDEEASSQPRWIETKLKTGRSGDLEVTQTTNPNGSFPWGRLFVCGYGAHRGITGAESLYEKYAAVDSVYTLFSYESQLQNAEIIVTRLGRSGSIKVEDVLERLDMILMLPPGSTQLTSAGLKIRGPWGTYKLGHVGDGYSSTLTWICDLFGWWAMFAKDKILQLDPAGIVLVDELEQHLHPRWQQSIVKLLNDQFPRVQFITTTHAPICAIGTTDLTDEECELILLRRTGSEEVKGEEDIPPPRRLRADQVLTSYLFELERTASSDIAGDISRYSHLKSKRERRADEEQEMAELHDRLVRDLGSEETELQRIVRRAIRETFDKRAKDLSATQIPEEALDFEIKRQLGELFDLGKKE